MTNIDKASEIANYWYGANGIPTQEVCISFDSAYRMAEWKDEQFNEEKKELFGLVKMLRVDETNQTIIEDLIEMLR